MTDVALVLPHQTGYRAETPWRPFPALVVALVASLAPIAVGLAGIYVRLSGLLTPDGHPMPITLPSLASSFDLAVMITGQLISFGLIWIAAGWRQARAQTLRLATPQAGWLTSAGYGLALMVLIGPLEILLYGLAGLGLFTDARWLLEGLRSPNWWGVVIAAVILAPLWEEFTFRGFLLSALAKSRLGYWPAAVISTLIWTTLHAAYSWPGLASVFLAGLGLSWIMKRTGSMRAAVTVHGVINACSLAISYVLAP